MSFFSRLLGTAPDPREAIRPLWHRVGELAREPSYYADCHVADSVGGRFDLIVSNPPYIAASEMKSLQAEVHREPRMALTDDADGLSHYRTIAAGAMDHLTDQGRILVEIGPTQARAVSALFAAAGLENITTHPDLDGRDRVVSALKTA